MIRSIRTLVRLYRAGCLESDDCSGDCGATTMKNPRSSVCDHRDLRLLFHFNRKFVSLQRVFLPLQQEIRFAPTMCCSASTGKPFHCNGVAFRSNGKTASQQRRPFRCNVGSDSLQRMVFHFTRKTVSLQREVVPLQHEFYFSPLLFTATGRLITRTGKEARMKPVLHVYSIKLLGLSIKLLRDSIKLLRLDPALLTGHSDFSEGPMSDARSCISGDV